MACRIEECGYGSARSGMCSLHAQRWERSGRPAVESWLRAAPTVRQPAAGALCRVAHCVLWPRAAGQLCHAHDATWRANGRPEMEEFIGRFEPAAVHADQIVRLDGLPPQLKLELQYALQCRRGDRGTKTPPAVVMQVVRFLRQTAASSLLEHPEEHWRTSIGRPAPKDSNPRALLLYARRRIEDLAQAGGWEGEYGRDVWQLRRLGFEGNTALSFEPIPQPWLRSLVKRWVRWRLSAGLVLETVRRGLRSLTRFALFCHGAGVGSLAEVDRAVLERYLADLQAEMAGSQRHGDQIGQLNSFLTAIRTQAWDTTLPATAMLFGTDYPQRSERPPRALAEQVMAQIEHRENLDRFEDEAHRLATLILIRCGLRVNDALRLERDCIVLDADRAPYLRYFNHKMKREALVPIDEELQALISARQSSLGPSPLLFPRPTKNPDGLQPMSSGTYRGALYRWLERCEIRDEHGQPAHLTPHQWRHTLGTRLINRDVPQEVVRRILDHDSPQMTAHYARLHDTTIRRHWETARKIDISGTTVVLDPESALAEAAWAKQRLGRATQALPNGFCGLPVQKTCPHANACLTCPMFITTGEFLPQHREHRTQVLQIISAAEARGQTRLAEMNRQVAQNLDTIISTLQDEPVPTDRTADAS
jgi:integrase